MYTWRHTPHMFTLFYPPSMSLVRRDRGKLPHPRASATALPVRMRVVQWPLAARRKSGLCFGLRGRIKQSNVNPWLINPGLIHQVLSSYIIIYTIIYHHIPSYTIVTVNPWFMSTLVDCFCGASPSSTSTSGYWNGISPSHKQPSWFPPHLCLARGRLQG